MRALDETGNARTATNRPAFLPQALAFSAHMFPWSCNLPRERYDSREPVSKKKIPGNRSRQGATDSPGNRHSDSMGDKISTMNKNQPGILGRIRIGLFALGLNVSRQTPAAEVLGLIEKLRPMDCGKELIRIGKAGDGGYLIPNDLKGIEYCFSPGVNTVSDFENHLADLHIRSFLADYSVAAPPIARPEFIFDKKFLGASDRDPYFTLQTWKDKYLKDYPGDLILQMDIDRCEYEVIFNIPDSLLNQFRIMVIEFHDLEKLFDPFSFTLMSSCFEKILKFFHVVHIHPNNCHTEVSRRGAVEVPKIMEFTFYNKRRVRDARAQTVFPHQLDEDNTALLPSVRLPVCWYSST